MTKKLLRSFALAIATIMLAVACNSDTQLYDDEVVTRSASEANILQIWWDKGYTFQEDIAINQIVDTWQQQSGQKAKIKFYTADEITQKAQRAIQAGNSPDVLFSSRAEYPPPEQAADTKSCFHRTLKTCVKSQRAMPACSRKGLVRMQSRRTCPHAVRTIFCH